jgi:phosphatidylglycerophosphatase C
LVAYALRLMSNHRAKARLLHVSLAGRQLADIGRLADDFVQHDLPALWHPWTLRQLTQHQQLGHRCVIVSASPGIYLHAVAAHLQVDAVLCTEMEWQGDALTGRLTTPNCHGLEKVRRLQAWLDATLGPDAKTVLHAYGDTQGDKPMLRLADHAWYRGKTWFPP